MNPMKTATLAAVLATATAAGIAPAAPAQASGGHHRAPAGCASDALCAYAGAGYTGAVSTFAFHHSASRAEPALARAKSLYNNVPRGVDEQGRAGGWCWKIYNGPDFTGRSMVIRPNTGVADVSAAFGEIKSDHTEWCSG
ncbi:peptidase inhibitor family I36 protein [Streptacidiphilus griseoplanus]|uniref:peptidase inhibitor family I36 protein n=1 Tax=Peterkaempfera griseoplana TaxID=66896 RepID=UPI0006E331BC|nr:peptidase inhibitor family I36 protein [Peterkaempfera griseoplana]